MDALDAFSGKFSEHLSRVALERRMPLSGTFELLPFCNLRCKMCYIVHENEKQYKSAVKSVEFWDQKINECIDAGMLYALITGGEPFLYPGIQELLERINKKPIHLAINTNGTLLDEKKVEWLSKVYPGRLNISLYGGNNETYGRLCGNPKGFDQVTRAFELLNAYQIPFRVHSTITPENVSDFDEIIDVCNQYRAPLQMVHYMFPPYRKERDCVPDFSRFTPKEEANVALRILKSKIKDKRDLRMRLEATCATFQHPELYKMYGVDRVSCRGGLSTFWVNWRGQLSGCGINDKEKIDLTQHDFEYAWKEVVASTESIRTSQKCRYCQYRCICPVCAASAFCETGSHNGTPEHLCEFCEHYSKLLIHELELLRKENV